MKTKRRLELFAFWQPEEICRHLEDMAQKGWLLLEITHPFWRYRQIPPKKISFDIAYFASASEYDFQLSPAQEEFRDLCAHDGWELSCTYGQMMIFYNTRENPTPLETEPELKLEAIHTYAMKNFLRILGGLLLLLLLDSLQMIAQLQRTPISLLTDAHQLFSMFCFVLLGITYLVQGLLYLRWYTRAKYAAQAGVFLNPGNFSGMLRGTVGGFLVLWVYQVSLSFPAETALQRCCICWTVCIWAICLHQLVFNNTGVFEGEKLVQGDGANDYLVSGSRGAAGSGLGADVGNSADSGCGLRSANAVKQWC